MAQQQKAVPLVILALAAVLIGAGVYLLNDTASERGAELALPPALPKPTIDALNETIARGRRAFIENYAQTAWESVANGGYVEYTDAEGKTTRYGPDAYIACNLYLIIHYAMYSRQFEIPEDDPLLQKIIAWLVEQFDEEQGRWIWSEEGCVHSKGMIALAKHGRADLAEKGWEWGKQSPMWLPDYAMFTMMQSGNIIQTLGSAKLSLTGQHDWEHGAAIPDAESTMKFLYAIFSAGKMLDDPDVAEVFHGVDRYFEHNPLTFAEMNTRDVVGMAWFVFATHDFDLPKGAGYRFCVDTMLQSVDERLLLQHHALTEHFYALRGLVIKALLMAGEHRPAMDQQVAIMLRRQADDGSWPLTPEGKKSWGLDRKPPVGIKMGQMDGANTYLTTLNLMGYRDLVFGNAAEAGPAI